MKKNTIIFSLLFIIQLIMDIAFYFTCKWAWTLNMYLDSFADNYYADHIAPFLFTIMGIAIYIYCYIKSGGLQEMYTVATTQTPKEQYFCFIHGPFVSRLFITFAWVLYYHSSFGLAVWGGYFGVALIASFIIEFEIILPRLFFMEYDLIFGRIRFPFGPKKYKD